MSASARPFSAADELIAVIRRVIRPHCFRPAAHHIPNRT
jgi:hypothetical protein